MPKVKNVFWRFFASVKLALFSLIILALTSTIGTLIKQGQAPSYYLQEYGPGLSRFFEILDFTNMYKSWWFAALLGLFAVNLVVCTIDRLPGVWRLVVQDNLSHDPQKLAKMGLTHRLGTDLAVNVAAERLQGVLREAGWKGARRLDREGSILLFAQKGAWTRLGVYIVHLSVLVILVGAMLGTWFGFQAYVFLPEGRSTGNIFLQGSKKPVPLGFELQCDRFERTFYDNGMIKQYRADLTVFDPERQAPYQKSIIVNDPLTYRGLTFYQADSYPLEEYLVLIRERATGREQAFRVPSAMDVDWREASFRIEELDSNQDGAVKRAKIRFSADNTAEAAVFWLGNQDSLTIRQAAKEFTVSFRQYYSTLLLVTKDPGIWIVYFGCLLMVAGLSICFFLSHRRIWLLVSPGEERGSAVLLSGTSNKNKPAFEHRFRELIDRLEREADFATGRN